VGREPGLDVARGTPGNRGDDSSRGDSHPPIVGAPGNHGADPPGPTRSPVATTVATTGVTTVVSTVDDTADRLGACLTVAALAHRGQKDKQGKPYLSHPLRVAARVLDKGGDWTAVMAALLHDVIEDGGFSRADLEARGIAPQVCDALELLSRDKHTESYEDFILRIMESGNATAILVKTCDLEDNLDTSRGPVPEALVGRYRRALALLAP